MSGLALVDTATRWFTDNDRHRSRTVTHVADLVRALQPLRETEVSRMLDVGCGYGGLGGSGCGVLANRTDPSQECPESREAVRRV